MHTGWQLICDNVYLFRETCNVYAVRSGSDAVLIDFGSGLAWDALEQIGVSRVTDVLVTHHHRDQVQGLMLAARAGARVWVPHAEQDLIAGVDGHWQAREVRNSYNNRQDRFSLLEPVPIHGTLQDYARLETGGHTFTVLPTPGHTIGSVSLMLEAGGGGRIAFTGDLIYGPGQLWSLAATQWTYAGAEGVAAHLLSILDLKDRQPDLLLPAHGAPVTQPAEAIDLLAANLRELMSLRREHRGLENLRANPFTPITPHLLRNRTSMSDSYVLLSDSGKALVIDFGYDFILGFPLPAGADRASRRPWLYNLPALKQQFGVTAIDVAIPTHFHDDHVAGLNLLRSVEGTQIWVPENFADVLANPGHYDLPCLWYDPIPADRTLPLEQTIPWEEYQITLHPLAGHTTYAVAICFEVDGKRVIANGDQEADGPGDLLNYVYKNGFRPEDFCQSALLYRRIRPDLILSGHWGARQVTDEYLDLLLAKGKKLAELHRRLLPPGRDLEEFMGRLTPYETVTRVGETVRLQASIQNPFLHAVEIVASLTVPDGWAAETPARVVTAAAGEIVTIDYFVTPAGHPARRARVALDLTIDGTPCGQVAESLITIR
ncbi:MAG: fold metallo-hydrolase [Symbiobacteriaceae bacterium]|jgi:glyoxylase-like metal-dependent hydrolase (beta-lactamase superfamily II)|nr:fold metallo-hydrolase [Symbiobacteriaceae bacterium]